MRVETSLPIGDLREVGEVAARLEASGYDTITTEETRHDPFLPLAVAAVDTTTVGLATGVAIASSRSPMVAARLGWDLQKASNGRFELGLGTQVESDEGSVGAPAPAPPPRLEEYVWAVREIWQTWAEAQPLALDGEPCRFEPMTPSSTPDPLDVPPPRISIAADGPGSVRVAGRVADGVRLHPFCTRDYVEASVLPLLEAGLAAAGRDRSSFTIAGGGFVCTGPDDEAVAEAMDRVRYRIGCCGSTRAFWPVLAQHDLVELGERLSHLSESGGWDEMAALIDDDTVRLFAAVGRHDQIVDAIAERFGGISDCVGLGSGLGSGTALDVPPDLLSDIRAT